MRKKSGFTIVEQAITLVPEFENVVRKLEQQVTLRGQSKYKKDRVVPLAKSMAVGLKKYLAAENPHIWLFNGKESDGRYSVRGLSWVMRENLKKNSITKDVNLHLLRHSFATQKHKNLQYFQELPVSSTIKTTENCH